MILEDLTPHTVLRVLCGAGVAGVAKFPFPNAVRTPSGDLHLNAYCYGIKTGREQLEELSDATAATIADDDGPSCLYCLGSRSERLPRELAARVVPIEQLVCVAAKLVGVRRDDGDVLVKRVASVVDELTFPDVTLRGLSTDDGAAVAEWAWDRCRDVAGDCRAVLAGRFGLVHGSTGRVKAMLALDQRCLPRQGAAVPVELHGQRRLVSYRTGSYSKLHLLTLWLFADHLDVHAGLERPVRYGGGGFDQQVIVSGPEAIVDWLAATGTMPVTGAAVEDRDLAVAAVELRSSLPPSASLDDAVELAGRLVAV